MSEEFGEGISTGEPTGEIGGDSTGELGEVGAGGDAAQLPEGGAIAAETVSATDFNALKEQIAQQAETMNRLQAQNMMLNENYQQATARVDGLLSQGFSGEPDIDPEEIDVQPTAAVPQEYQQKLEDLENFKRSYEIKQAQDRIVSETTAAINALPENERLLVDSNEVYARLGQAGGGNRKIADIVKEVHTRRIAMMKKQGYEMKKQTTPPHLRGGGSPEPKRPAYTGSKSEQREQAAQWLATRMAKRADMV